ncbi:MAG: hypothetical protein E7264_07045 [Lachnospiraceae bacterium]|nr:hypothetical protein [Lachnospiraceae bacterium]
MVDQELLVAISNLLEEKLEIKLQPIRQDIAELKADVNELKADVNELKADVNELKVDNKNLHARLDSLEKEVKKNSLILENEVLPRLQTIEQCYVESSKIFMRKSDQIDKMQDDIDVMKIVIQEHGSKLEMIS